MEAKTSKGREIKMAETTPDQNKTLSLEILVFRHLRRDDALGLLR